MPSPTTPRRRWPYLLLGLLLLVTLGVVFALSRADAWLTAIAQEQAGKLSQRIGRPITLESVSVKLLGGLGAKVAGLRIAAVEGESDPLLELERVSVDADLWLAAQTKGKSLHVSSVEISGLHVNLVKRADGKTNVDLVTESLERTAPPEEAEQPEEAKPAQKEPGFDLSGFVLDRFAFLDGQVHLVDQSGKAGAKPKALGLSDIDLLLENVRLGQPLKLSMKAAVLASAQNLDVTLETAPIPETFEVLPTQVTWSLAPIDLAPLAAFSAGLEGLLAGKLSTQGKVSLGSAVPGGSGPTHVEAELAARGLAFEQTQGGKPADLTVDVKLTADLPKGDVALQKLELALGPARVSGRGTVSKLYTEAPAASGLELVGTNLDPASFALYYPPLGKLLANRISGPIQLRLEGSGSQRWQALTLSMDLTSTRLDVPGELTKQPGGPLTLKTTMGGSATGALRFELEGDLGGVDLRPGELLNKSSKDALRLAMKGSYDGTGGTKRIELSTLDVTIQDQRMSGSAKATLAGTGKKATTQFEATLASDRLDVDKLLLEDETPKKPEPGEKKAAAPAPSAGATAKVPAKDPHRFDGMQGTFTARIGALRVSEKDFADVDAKVKMVNDLVTLERFSARTFGGRVDASGTTARLGPAERPFELVFKTEAIDVAQILLGAGKPPSVSGRLSADFKLKGLGADKKSLMKSLEGLLQGDLKNASLEGTDLFGGVLAPILKGLPFPGAQLKADKMTALGSELPFGLELKDGVAQLKKPMTLTKPQGAMQLSGGVGLDGMLALDGLANISPETIASLTKGRAKPDKPLPVPFKVTGPVWKPEVSSVDAKPALVEIAKLAAMGVAGALLGDKAEKAKQALEDSKATLEAKRKEAEAKAAEEKAKLEAKVAEERAQAEAKAAEEKAKLEAKAREEAERNKQKLQEQAKDKLKGLFGK